MTSANRLRSLVKEATRGEEWHAQPPISPSSQWEVTTDDDLVCEIDIRTLLDFDKRDEMQARLIALAPQLAELVADMADVIQEYIDAFPQDEVWADTNLLDRLAALFPEDSA